jgi:enoyl-CoA hydratase/carnithine racemase
MDEPCMLVSVADSILEVIFNRPAKLNAINGDMYDVLVEQTDRFANDPSLRVLLIRARGKYFSAGVDLNSELGPAPNMKSPIAFRQWYREGRGSLHPLLDRFELIEKPIVVAHHAPCLGGALEMSLSCDFRLASQSARYGLPETAFGNIPGSGGTSRMTRLVGPQWARWFIMANLQMDAAKAERIGLVHDVYPDDEFDARVRDFCLNLAKQPPETIGAAKLAIELTADLDRAQARNVERLTASGLYFGDEFRTLIAALRAKLSAKS